MNTFKLLKQLKKIEKHCDKNKDLEEKLNNYVPKGKTVSDLSIEDVHKLVNYYESIKDDYK